MLQELISELNKYKTIGIFGYGKEGKSFEIFANKYLQNTKIIIIDQKNGENYLNSLYDVELIVKSPGVSLYNLGICYDDFNFTSGTELFLKYFGSNTIGVTGTKGKSTLCTIIDSMLKNDNQKSFLCGNIGVPVFDIIDQIDNKSQIVIELSSHQLENISFSPHIAILINLFEEHLDYYKDCEAYHEAKHNIFKYQTKDDIAIVNFEQIPQKVQDSIVCKRWTNCFGNKLKYQHHFKITQGFIHNSSLQILEAYVDMLQMPQEVYIYTINQFRTLHHRLEYVGVYNGIRFINDSISTIPQTTIEAVKMLQTVDTVATVIIGGFNRGVNYQELIDFLANSNIKNIILCSETGKIIFDALNTNNVHYKSTLNEAIKLAKELTSKDELCLFSPASASFDQFENFMVRGEYFKNQIKDNNQ